MKENEIKSEGEEKRRMEKKVEKENHKKENLKGDL